MGNERIEQLETANNGRDNTVMPNVANNVSSNTVKSDVRGTINGIGKKIGGAFKEKGNVRREKPLVSARVLFISVLDKIFLVILVLMLIGMTYVTFAGNLSSMSYGFWSRVGTYLIELIVFVIVYFFFNWIYRCAARTMLCLTEKEVYGEKYVPFKKSEFNIPLSKITKASTIDIFWIFRVLIIHQYHQFPVVFWTWNNHVFKDKLNELLINTDVKVLNEYEKRNIIPKKWEKYLLYLGAGLVGIVLLVGIGRAFGCLFSPAKSIPGTYSYNGRQIVLNKDGSCNVDSLVSNDVKSCSWEYYESSEDVAVTYTYEYKSWYSGTQTSEGTLSLDFDSSKKTLSYSGNTYTK